MTSTPKPKHLTLAPDAIMIRTDNGGTSYGGFCWQPKGRWTVAPDWNPKPECGNGLHGQHVSAGGFRGKWTKRAIACRIDADKVVQIGDDKIKVRRAKIIAVNNLSCLPPMAFSGSLDLSVCTGLTRLPDGLTVGRSLYLSGCTGLTALPDGLRVGGWLDLSGCTGLTRLPDGLTVGGWLDLSGCTGLTCLPDGLTFGGSLYLAGCTGLTCLPDGLTVGGSLYLAGCTGLTCLPDGLKTKHIYGWKNR